MVERKAIVLINGLLGAIPDGDSLNLPSLTSSQFNSDGYISFNVTDETPTMEDDLINITYNSLLSFKFVKEDSFSEISTLVPSYLKFESTNGYGLKFISNSGNILFGNSNNNYFSITSSSNNINFNINQNFNLNTILPTSNLGTYNILFRPSYGVFDGEMSGNIKLQFRDAQSGINSGSLVFESYNGGEYIPVARMKPFEDEFQIQTSSSINFNLFSLNAPASLGTLNAFKFESTPSDLSFNIWRSNAWEKMASIISDTAGSFYFVKDIDFLTSDVLIGWNSSGGISINADANIGISTNSGEVSLGASDALNFNIQSYEQRNFIDVSTYSISFNTSVNIAPQTNNLGAGHTLTISGGAAAPGNVGGKIIIGANNGGTPGTNLAGDIELQVGSEVAAQSAKVMLKSGTRNVMSFQRYANNYCRISNEESSGGITINCGSGSFGAESFSSIVFRNSSPGNILGFVIQSDRTTRFDNSTLKRYHQNIIAELITSSVGTQTIHTLATMADRTYQLIAYITVFNATDNESSSYIRRALIRNIGGTLTQVGSTQIPIADLQDAGQTGLSASFAISGTNILTQFTTDSTNQHQINLVLDVYERVKA